MKEVQKMKEKSKKKIVALVALALFLFAGLAMVTGCSGCASCSRSCVDFQSNINGGLDRVINIYTANGDLIATYKGKIDLDSNEGGYVKFDFDGKRYIYYNCFVESIADIE